MWALGDSTVNFFNDYFTTKRDVTACVWLDPVTACVYMLDFDDSRALAYRSISTIDTLTCVVCKSNLGLMIGMSLCRSYAPSNSLSGLIFNLN